MDPQQKFLSLFEELSGLTLLSNFAAAAEQNKLGDMDDVSKEYMVHEAKRLIAALESYPETA